MNVDYNYNYKLRLLKLSWIKYRVTESTFDLVDKYSTTTKTILTSMQYKKSDSSLKLKWKNLLKYCIDISFTPTEKSYYVYIIFCSLYTVFLIQYSVYYEIYIRASRCITTLAHTRLDNFQFFFFFAYIGEDFLLIYSLWGF